MAKFKYRSLDDLGKKNILENQRTQLESSHYALSVRGDMLDSLEPPEDETEASQREREVESCRKQARDLEGLLDKINDELLTLNESVSADEGKDGEG